MTTRTELIAELRDFGRYALSPVMNEAADMLEADAVNDDLTIAYMSGFKAGEDKYKAAAQLALDALEKLWLLGDEAGSIANPAIAALNEVL